MNARQSLEDLQNHLHTYKVGKAPLLLENQQYISITLENQQYICPLKTYKSFISIVEL